MDLHTSDSFQDDLEVLRFLSVLAAGEKSVHGTNALGKTAQRVTTSVNITL